MSGSAPIGSSAEGAHRYAEAAKGRVRQVATPEGIALHLTIASAGARLGGLMLDLFFQGLITFLLALALGFATVMDSQTRGIIASLCFFLIANFWFIFFELGPRAATPGKRIVSTRVVARDGGQLTVAAIVARNFVRPFEMGLPLMFLFSGFSGGAATAMKVVFGLMWTVGLGLFLLLNRDRMRLGDVIAGTWVVNARKHRLSQDLSATSDAAAMPGAPVFSPEELSIYGVFELQELERVLREDDLKTVIIVADTIRAKLGRELMESDHVFLTAYYRQLKAKQERDLLFGKRRENKYEV